MNLQLREKIFVTVGVILLVLVMGYLLLIEPQIKRQEDLQYLIPKKESQIAECKLMIAEYYRMKGILDDQKTKIEDQESTQIQSFLDTLATELEITIASMVPKVVDLNDEYQEYQVEIKIDRIKLDHLIKFLFRLENTDKMLTIKTIRIKRRYDDHTLSDVIMIISTLILK